jgi:hypothetical protein
MRRLMTIAAAIVSIAGSAELGGSAQAGSIPNAGLGEVTNGALPLEQVQFYWGGYNYCWYAEAWNGPGWYYCGYPWNYGWVGAAVGDGTAGTRITTFIIMAVAAGSGHDRREMEAERRAFSARAASWLVAKNFIDGSENRPHVFVRKIVVDRLSLAPRLNETIEAEAGELLRYGRLA